MGGHEPWIEAERESMQREYRMRSVEAIVGDDGICDEEVPGIVAMADKLVHYVMTGEHNMPMAQPEPGFSLKDLTTANGTDPMLARRADDVAFAEKTLKPGQGDR